MGAAVVRLHNGWLEVESRTNLGTTFRIHLAASKQPVDLTEVVVDTAVLSGRQTVLAAEDEETLRQMVVQILRFQGYTVLEAASGRDALDVWERSNRPIDLVLTDMVMPGGIMGGELAECLSSQYPRLKVIYTSGYSPGMAGKDASILRRRNFLAKPYLISKLAQFVRECLDSTAKENRILPPVSFAHERPINTGYFRNHPLQ